MLAQVFGLPPEALQTSALCTYSVFQIQNLENTSSRNKGSNTEEIEKLLAVGKAVTVECHCQFIFTNSQQNVSPKT